ncbi:MAG: MarR family transcriptional regulator [Candidatus Nanopelagicales bacterium]|jgi:DNA-binding MarR family transcriptional regulator|nr:MarR family transcriptional regulator [Candidatus Nanopelagicales bacterium]
MARQPSPAQLLLDNQLCFLFHRIARDLNAAYRPLLADLGLTYPQYLVMLVLWERDGRTVGELGQELCLDSGTLSPLLRRLEAMELVERQRDPADERRVTVHLSREGWALRRRARNIPQALGHKIVDNPEEYQNLHAQLTRIAQRLEA